MAMPVEHTNRYFHVASSDASERRWYMIPAALSVVASMRIHVTAMLSAK